MLPSICQKVLVTGANGFIGRSLCLFLKRKDYYVLAGIRNHIRDIIGADEYIEIDNIGPETDWGQALKGVDVVIHLAARVHIANDLANDPADEFRKVNALGTERLARMAAKAEVKRFIFISSVKVNGEGALQAYTENDIPASEDAYGISKREAEDLLVDVASKTGLELVTFRLPLVYGPGVKANFNNLIAIAGSSLPLPFKGINNLRSFLYLGNLVDAIATCVQHPKAAGETFLLSDGQDMSTPDLIKLIARAMNKNITLFYLPPAILKTLCKVLGKSEEWKKITTSLLVDSSKIQNLLSWKPPFTLEEGIMKTVRYCK